MHGLQSMKYLNDKAAADAIMAKHKGNGLSEQQAKDFAEALAQKAQEKIAK
jgi:hypothetical protein